MHLDMINVKLNQLTQKELNTKIVDESAIISYETDNFSIKKILESDDKEKKFLIEELRYPITFSLKEYINKINSFINYYEIVTSLKYLNQQIILLEKNTSQSNYKILQLYKKKWNILYDIFEILLKLKFFYENKLDNDNLQKEKSDMNKEKNVLEICYYLNKLASNKFIELKNKGIINSEDSYNYSCIHKDINHYNKKDYYKLLANQKQFLIRNPNNKDKYIINNVIINKSNLEYGVIIKNLGKDKFRVLYPLNNNKKEDLNIEDFSVVQGISNKIYSIDEKNKEMDIKNIIIDNPFYEEFSTNINDNLENIYHYCVTKFIKYLKISNKVFNTDDIVSFFKDIFYFNTNYGFFYKSDVHKGGAKKDDIIRYIDEYYLSLEDTLTTRNILKKFLKKNSIDLDATSLLKDNDQNKWIITKNEKKWNARYYKNVETSRIYLESLSSNSIKIPKPEILETFKFNREEVIHLSSDSSSITTSYVDTSSDDSSLVSSDISRDNVFKIQYNNQFNLSTITFSDITLRPYSIQYEISFKNFYNLLKNRVSNLDKFKFIENNNLLQELDNIENQVIYLKDDSELDFKITINELEILNNKDDIEISDDLYSKDTKERIIITNNHLFSKLDIVSIKNHLEFKKLYNYDSKYTFYLFGIQINNISEGLKLFSMYNFDDTKLKELKYNLDLFVSPSKYWNMKIGDLSINPKYNVFTQMGLHIDELIKHFSNLTLNNLFLKILLYAQFNQNVKLREALLLTQNIPLLSPFKDTKTFYYLNSLMDLRYQIQSSKIPIYYNLEKEKELKLQYLNNIENTKKLSEFLLSINSITLCLPQTQEIKKFMDENNIPTEILDDLYNNIEFLEKRLYIEENIKQKQQKRLNEITSISKKYLLDNKVESLSYDYSNFDQTLNLINDYLKLNNLTYYNVPGDGDCLFYTILDQLYINDILPDEYNTIQNLIGDKYVFTESALKLRYEVANKIRSNKLSILDKSVSKIKNENGDLEEIQTNLILSSLIEQEAINENLVGDDLFEEYCKSISLSCNSDNLTQGSKTGIWGGEIEINIMAALFNCNIYYTSFIPNSKLNIIKEGPNFSISAEYSRKLFPLGTIYNTDKPIKSLYIVRIIYNDKNAHYISTRPLDTLMTYYYCPNNMNVIRKTYISDTKKINNILVGKNFNNGTFEYIEDKYANNSVHDCIEIRYFKHKDLVYYNGLEIGNYIDNENGIYFDGIPPITITPFKNIFTIIIPFRQDPPDKLVYLSDNHLKNRTQQLIELLNYLTNYFKDNTNYNILVVEQKPILNEETNNYKCKFNRGLLLNLGFLYADLNLKSNYYIFHDLDLKPEYELKKEYNKIPSNNEIIHLSANWDRYSALAEYLGGVFSISSKLFTDINGFPNNYWGWGGEDDELLRRTKSFSLIKQNPFIEIKKSKGKYEDLENIPTYKEKTKQLAKFKEWRDFKDDDKQKQKNKEKQEHKYNFENNLNGLNSIKINSNGEFVNSDTLDNEVIAKKEEFKTPMHDLLENNPNITLISYDLECK